MTSDLTICQYNKGRVNIHKSLAKAIDLEDTDVLLAKVEDKTIILKKIDPSDLSKLNGDKND